MPSLKDLRNRITSVKSTQKITKAMKMVAAAKLRKAQENAEKGRAYSEKMNNIIGNLKQSIADVSSAPKLLAGNDKSEIHLCLHQIFFVRCARGAPSFTCECGTNPIVSSRVQVDS